MPNSNIAGMVVFCPSVLLQQFVYIIEEGANCTGLDSPYYLLGSILFENRDCHVLSFQCAGLSASEMAQAMCIQSSNPRRVKVGANLSSKQSALGGQGLSFTLSDPSPARPTCLPCHV